jgi:hypothetical protein
VIFLAQIEGLIMNLYEGLKDVLLAESKTLSDPCTEISKLVVWFTKTISSEIGNAKGRMTTALVIPSEEGLVIPSVTDAGDAEDPKTLAIFTKLLLAVTYVWFQFNKVAPCWNRGSHVHNDGEGLVELMIQ